MFSFEEELKEQIIEELQLDDLIKKHINVLDEKHKSEVEDTGTYADWFPLNDVKKDIIKELGQIITRKKTKPKGSDNHKEKLKAELRLAYSRLTNKRGWSKKEAINLLQSKPKYSQWTFQTIESYLKK